MHRLMFKGALGFAVLLASLAMVPAAKADPLVISSNGFHLTNLGNDGSVPNGLDTLIGAASSHTGSIDEGTFIATLNYLTFEMGFTGIDSPGSYNFAVSQLLTINGQTRAIDLFGQIDIGIITDTAHILSSAPLTFTFDTFTVDVMILPTSVSGTFSGEFSEVLQAQFTVRNVNEPDPVPEPATLTLLGLGVASTAAKLYRRRRQALTRSDAS
jgi:PEP-CTERM motif